MNSTQAEKYLASGGDHCPYCSAAAIGYNEEATTLRDGVSEQPAVCRYCGKTWTDIFTLTGVDGFRRVEGK